MGTKTWQLPIIATFLDCKSTRLSFSQKPIIVTTKYLLGSGPLELILPQVFEESDCSPTELDLKMKVTDIQSSLSDEQVLAAVRFDGSTKTLSIETEDFTFIG